ncbi:hypothetical protein HPB49_005432 [Dermacentor silvarum]|uniref:Uncharacterized protein n=1 Tax=Dermacentor silvarum TaxID=543639 RepID=A0ACB8D306_DERSI|nr:hypothetical protein HPB49_005432 [Dermacentor silvarum]
MRSISAVVELITHGTASLYRHTLTPQQKGGTVTPSPRLPASNSTGGHAAEPPALVSRVTKCNLKRDRYSQLPYSARKDVLNAKMDSENLADWVGTITAYAAFAALSSSESNVTLAGLDMSAERLFYVNHCVTWCHQYSTLTGNYAPYRSRCIVPLMNMPEFSRTFGCAPGEPMNPRNKCTFWH